jgi:YidC/Oxa1 family membrane protein insertase
MQQKNLLLFIALCALLLFGWPWLMNRIWGPKQRRNEGQQIDHRLPPTGVRRDLLAQLSAVPIPTVSGIPAYIAAVVQPFAPNLARRSMSKKDRLAAIDFLAGLMPGGLSSSGLDNVVTAWANAQAHSATPPKLYTLGNPADPSFYINAVLTTKGAGIEKLILSKFEAATREGRPAGRLLELIQEDPILPSFLMYHYPDVDKEDSRPVTTLGEKLWEYKGGDDTKRVFATTLPGKTPEQGDLLLTKTYTLAPKEYHIGVTLEIEHQGRPGVKAEPIKFRYQFVGPHGIPIEGEWYTSVFRNPMIAWVDSRKTVWRDLDNTQQRISFHQGGDRVPAAGLAPGAFIQYGGIASQFFASLIVPDEKQSPNDPGGVDFKQILDYVRPTLESQEKRGRIKGLTEVGGKIAELILAGADDNGKDDLRFLLLPRVQKRLNEEKIKEGSDVVLNYYTERGKLVATDIRRGRSFRPYSEDITVRAVSRPIELKPGEKVVHKCLLYNGPVKVRLLSQFTGDKAVDATLVTRYADDLHLSTLTDYRSAGPFGAIAQKIFWTDLLIWCTQRMHELLNLLHRVVPIYGLTIILLTVLVRGLMFPISRRQAQISMKMQELAPEMKKLQEKYKDNPQGRNQAVMELYRRHKVNPLGGCLPLLLQMPIFLGLYYALGESIHFRLASFLWIPNLAAPDMLIRWGESIPFISDPDNHGSIFFLGPFFNLLPVVAVAFMIVQQKFLMPPPQDDQQAFQQKLMKYMMIFFGIMFYKVAAGLCLYFIVSSAWGLAERKLLPKRQTPAAGGAAAPPPPGGGTRRASPGGNGPAPAGRGKGRPVRKEKEKEVDGPIQKVRDWWAEVLKQAKKK